jgi:hypothetical protein
MIRTATLAVSLLFCLSGSVFAQNIAQKALWSLDEPTGVTIWGTFDKGTELFAPCDGSAVHHVIAQDVVKPHPGRTCPDGSSPRVIGMTALFHYSTQITTLTVGDKAKFQAFVTGGNGASFANAVHDNDTNAVIKYVEKIKQVSQPPNP